MRAICAAACLLPLIAPTTPAAAKDYPRFETYKANGWVITDTGRERCDADFIVDDDTLLGFLGPYYFSPGKLASGSIIHLAANKDYTLPKGDKYGEFPVQLVAGADSFSVSGFATDLGGALVADSGSLPTVLDLLAALPDSITLSAIVEDKPIYAIELNGNRAAAKALKDCTAFITAQKRPGTRNGPELGPPEMLSPEVMPAPADPPADAPAPGVPDAGPTIQLLP